MRNNEHTMLEHYYVHFKNSIIEEALIFYAHADEMYEEDIKENKKLIKELIDIGFDGVNGAHWKEIEMITNKTYGNEY